MYIGGMTLVQLEEHINKIVDARLSSDSWITTKQAMDLLNIKTKKTFYSYSEKLGFAKKKIGRSVRYSQKDISSKLSEL